MPHARRDRRMWQVDSFQRKLALVCSNLAPDAAARWVFCSRSYASRSRRIGFAQSGRWADSSSPLAGACVSAHAAASSPKYWRPSKRMAESHDVHATMTYVCVRWDRLV